MRRLALLLLLAGSACAPEIGDECATSVDCSVNGDRICDTNAPFGYCSVRNCEMDTCPEEAVCVQFRTEPARLADSWCMAGCEEDGDCRTDQGYLCLTAAELAMDDPELADVLDSSGPGTRFCGFPSVSE